MVSEVPPTHCQRTVKRSTYGCRPSACPLMGQADGRANGHLAGIKPNRLRRGQKVNEAGNECVGSATITSRLVCSSGLSLFVSQPCLAAVLAICAWQRPMDAGMPRSDRFRRSGRVLLRSGIWMRYVSQSLISGLLSA